MPSQDTIYLTFDDGPHPDVTPWVLSQLNTFKAKATFFCLGKNLEKNSTLARKIVSEGHQVGNHTYSHLNGWHTQDKAYIDDIQKADQVMRDLNWHSVLFRPPYGRIKRRQAAKLNHQIVMWSHLSWDFDPKLNVKKSLKHLKCAKPGSILVFHDTPKALNNLKKILPQLLIHFQKQGFKCESL